ncbi:S9 family peptidase [Nesterenkonia sphaerica]|uniref:S9 family peptidase n=1 Tax=Nesterenkonia sphaerica TaxID=1804988 RepID=A0A5R9A758_9MICC|nr:S9 family peptidase [Nesterenkonia sphaerica]TLP74468.1 S9 family peptidase [Nesterenkonia sphaerica]
MTTPSPPLAKKIPTQRTRHGDTFCDPYEWMRDKDDPQVLEHLAAENAYTEAVAAEQEPLRSAIYAEIKRRTVETDLSVPARRGSWWYFLRTIEGEQHPVFCRVPASAEASSLSAWTPPEVTAGETLPGEETYFNTNAEASAHPFYSLGGMAVSEDGTLLAYVEDTSGDEHFTLRLRNLQTGQALPESVENVHYGVHLSPDGKRAYYLTADAAWRPHRLWQHTVGTPATQDRLLLEITDVTQWLGAGLSADRRQLVIESGNSEWNATRLLDLTDPAAEPQLLVPAERRVLNSVAPCEVDGEAMLLITHNQQGPNNAVSLTTAEALLGQAGSDQLDLGPTVIQHDDAVKLDDSVIVTAAQVLVEARISANPSVRMLSWDTVRQVRDGAAGVKAASLPGPVFEDTMHTISVEQASYDAPLFRVRYSSWLVPDRIYDIPHQDPVPILRRETPVNDYHREDYRAVREWATAPDGTEVPVTVLHHKDLRRDGTHPAVIYGYGSYEISNDPGFAVPRLSLLDRGIVYAIAHVRGGGELGRLWYQNGKKLHKKNTFTDFLAVTDHLVDSGWADATRLAAMGGSAGGLLMGAVANLAPEKYRAIVAQVPFVDSLTTILDPEMPLSAGEWEEWGNPIEDPEVYRYMKSYSPYENVRPARYPAIAAVTSLHDTRVMYVEPAKWVPVLREHQLGQAPIVLKTELDGGHGGASGRYEKWKDRAWDYAWVASFISA